MEKSRATHGFRHPLIQTGKQVRQSLHETLALGLATLALTVLSISIAAPVYSYPLRVRLNFGVTADNNTASSLDTGLGFQNRNANSDSARLMWSGRVGGLQLKFHSHLAFNQGDTIAYATALAPYLPTPVPATLFNLTHTVSSSSTSMITNTIDRMSVGYAGPNLVVRVGRQAITWGNGMVFHPADIIAPFAPNAVDTSFKTGADMVYTQYLFDSGADIQMVAVPRGTTLGGPVDYDSSTFALLGRFQAGSLDVSGMIARDRGEAVANIGLSGALGGAAWNLDAIGWEMSDGTQVGSFIANISHSSVLLDRNITYVAEYFHNGFGVGNSVALDALPTTLTDKLATGQLFSLGRNYLALGGQIVLTPDVILAPNAVISLDDYSSLVGLQVNWAMGDNTNLVFNYFQPLGADGTEFGGRQTTAGSGIYLRSPQEISLSLVQFF